MENSSRPRPLIQFDGNQPGLQLFPGQCTVLIGPNGSGKTTLLRTLAGLNQASDECWLEGVSYRDLIETQIFARVQYYSDKVDESFNLRISEWIEIVSTRYSIDHEKLSRWISELGPKGAGIENRRMAELSHGELQRIRVALALSSKASVLLLDEVIAFTDIEAQFKIKRILKVLLSEGKSVLWVTHDLNWASAVADRVWILASGQSVRALDPGDPALLTELGLLYPTLQFRAGENPITGCPHWWVG